MMWDKIELEKIADISTGKYDVNHNVEDGKYPFYTCAIKPFKANTFSFHAPAILLPGNGANVGKFLYQEKGEFEAYQRTYVVNNLKGINPVFLKYCFAKNWERHLLGKQYGSATNYIRYNNLSKFVIPLPPLPIQKQIAEILDTADALRRATEAQLADLDALAQSVFLEMFYAKKSDYDSWNEVKFEELAANHKGSMRTGPFGSALKHDEFVSEGIAVLGIDNAVKNHFEWKRRRYITPEKYEKLKRYTIRPLDVIVTIMGTVGRSAVVPKDIPLSINTKHLAAITLDHAKANPYFFSFALRSHPAIKQQMRLRNRGAIMDGLNLTIIKSLKINMPPIELQNQFAQIIENIESQKAELKQSLKESEDLFNGLLQEVFG